MKARAIFYFIFSLSLSLALMFFAHTPPLFFFIYFRVSNFHQHIHSFFTLTTFKWDPNVVGPEQKSFLYPDT